MAHNMTQEILCIAKNMKEIYYEYEDKVKARAEIVYKEVNCVGVS
jgi:hypothetical protein